VPVGPIRALFALICLFGNLTSKDLQRYPGVTFRRIAERSGSLRDVPSTAA